MKLIIVRHGETKENVSDVMQGQNHGSLTRKGVLQAKRVGLKLKNEKLDAVFSSDLGRAVKTTKEIIKHHDVPVYYVRDLRERHAGVFQGRYRKEMFADRMARGLSEMQYRPKGGENIIDLQRRVKRFANRIQKKYKGNSVVLVMAHGLVIKCLASIYLHIPLDKAMKLKTVNTGVLVISVNKSGNRKIVDTMFRNG